MHLQLDVDYFGHPKTVNLRKLLGPNADVYPPRLWAWAAKYRPSGDKITLAELVHACHWTGAPERLAEGLVGAGSPGNDSGVTREPDRGHPGMAPGSLPGGSERADKPFRAGFLDRCQDGTLSIHNWHARTGRGIRLYEDKKRRMRDSYRGRSSENLPEENGNLPKICRPEDRRGQERTGEESTRTGGGPPAPPGARPAPGEVPPPPPPPPAAPPTPPHQVLLDAWARNPHLPRILAWTAKRAAAWRSRMKDRHWAGNWEKALERARGSDFLEGRAGNEAWRGMDVDFFLRPGTVAAILEGKYDNRPARTPKSRGEQVVDQMGKVVEELREKEIARGVPAAEIDAGIAEINRIAFDPAYRAQVQEQIDERNRRRAPGEPVGGAVPAPGPQPRPHGGAGAGPGRV